MIRRGLRLLLALAALSATACGRYLTTGVAVVNGRSISIDELKSRVASVYANPQFSGAIDPDDAEQRLQIERQIIVELIQDELVRQEARRRGIRVSPAEIDERLRAIQVVQPQELQREVQSRGMAAVRRLVESALLREKVADAAAGGTEPTIDELRAAYGNGARFEEIRVRHILFQVTGGDDAAARRRAEEALARLRAGADFAALARELSDDPGSKRAGGDLGYISRDVDFDQTFLNAAFAVREGRISGLVRTRFGYHIIRVDDRRSKTFEEVRDQLAAEIAEQKRTQAFQTFLIERIRSSEIVVNPRWGDFNPETFRIEAREFFVPASPEPETEPFPAP